MSLVSSSSGSEAKDDELSKKAESLENQLKATELEHARYVMLGTYQCPLVPLFLEWNLWKNT